jgi:hypothetical protein
MDTVNTGTIYEFVVLKKVCLALGVPWSTYIGEKDYLYP